MLRTLNLFERNIIDNILKMNLNCNHIQGLLEQSKILKVKKRTYTGVGFYTDLEVQDKNLILDENINLELGGIEPKIKGLNGEADFILWIKNGKIQCLEGFCYDGVWPKKPKIIG